MSDEYKCEHSDARCNAMVAAIRLRIHDELATDHGKEYASRVFAARLRNLAQPIMFVLHEVSSPDLSDTAMGEAQAALAEIVALAEALARTA